MLCSVFILAAVFVFGIVAGNRDASWDTNLLQHGNPWNLWHWKRRAEFAILAGIACFLEAPEGLLMRGATFVGCGGVLWLGHRIGIWIDGEPWESWTLRQIRRLWR
uniref:Uncharacterized protein n=1 Tax=viral metagenome TaxID=1070528 RepID=A0A6M3JPL8_9ZZZZ